MRNPEDGARRRLMALERHARDIVEEVFRRHGTSVGKWILDRAAQLAFQATKHKAEKEAQDDGPKRD